MGIFDRFRARVPEVAVGPHTREAIEARMAGLPHAPPAKVLAQAVRDMIQQDLWPVSGGWREALGPLEKEVEAELFLCAWAGCAGALAERHGWETALAVLEAPMADLREYVPFSCREHYDKGPQALIVYARMQLPKEPDVVKATLAVMARWMCLSDREGVLEGWLRLGLTAWMGGELMAECLTLENT